VARLEIRPQCNNVGAPLNKKAPGGRRPGVSEWGVRYFGAEVPPVAAPVLRPMFGEAFVGPAPLVTVS
jgi:hypothetical protein